MTSYPSEANLALHLFQARRFGSCGRTPSDSLSFAFHTPEGTATYIYNLIGANRILPCVHLFPLTCFLRPPGSMRAGVHHPHPTLDIQVWGMDWTGESMSTAKLQPLHMIQKQDIWFGRCGAPSGFFSGNHQHGELGTESKIL